MKNVKSVLYLILGLLISSLMACSDDPGAFLSLHRGRMKLLKDMSL